MPYDRNAFSESDFAPSLKTEMKMRKSAAVAQDLQNNDIEITSDAPEMNDDRPSNDDVPTTPLAQDTADAPRHSDAIAINASSFQDKEMSSTNLSP